MMNRSSEVTYSYSRADVIKAIVEAAGTISGMKLHSCDELSGHIVVKTGISMFSYGENIPIDVTEAPGSRNTLVRISSGAKTGLLFGGAADFGKNQKNIDQILAKTSEILKSQFTPVETDTGMSTINESVQKRLSELKSLLELDMISKDEYEEQRKRIINAL